MSDDLRTRIAAVLKFHYPGSSHLHDIVADAVIRELGLREERQPPGLLPDGSFIDITGTVWRHNGLEWTDDPIYRP